MEERIGKVHPLNSAKAPKILATLSSRSLVIKRESHFWFLVPLARCGAFPSSTGDKVDETKVATAAEWQATG